MIPPAFVLYESISNCARRSRPAFALRQGLCALFIAGATLALDFLSMTCFIGFGLPSPFPCVAFRRIGRRPHVLSDRAHSHCVVLRPVRPHGESMPALAIDFPSSLFEGPDIGEQVGHIRVRQIVDQTFRHDRSAGERLHGRDVWLAHEE